ncbi:hypothetical protein PYW08_009623 [Mythimna loreyi]|uniref:Uncharacterized protein n=1 Tax=Mythimna loreyi TaxID=667449 RepID=A0ACC2Q792_9NEOP|nr:hypothetical protein PYW08_009623 [Mythimna loreyi]
MTVIFVVCLAVWICVLIYWREKLVESQGHPLPPMYPGYLPIIGHSYMLLTGTSNLWNRLKNMCEYSIQQGGVMVCKFGFDIYYVISDPEDALVAANTCLDKHYLYSFAKYWLGEGLITGSGEHWHRHRNKLKTAFSQSIINGYLEVFNSQSKTLLTSLEDSLRKGSFYPIQHLKDFTFRISYITIFGKTVSDDQKFTQYVKGVDAILNLEMERIQKFWLHNDLIHNLLGYKKKENELAQCLNKISDEIIKTKRAILNKETDKLTYVPFQPLINHMLEQSNPFNDQEISEELHTAMTASFDITSRALQTILVMIGSFPKVQERMYEEIMQVVGKERDVDKDDLRKLIYTEAVIKESLRLIPPAPLIARYIDKDVKLKNYTMRAGSQCFIMLYGLERNSSWGPDANQFRPERWLDSATLPPYSTLDGFFSIGKRSCVGKTWALSALKIALSHILRKFVISADYTKLKFQIEIILEASSGHDISLELRS